MIPAEEGSVCLSLVFSTGRVGEVTVPTRSEGRSRIDAPHLPPS